MKIKKDFKNKLIASEDIDIESRVNQLLSSLDVTNTTLKDYRLRTALFLDFLRENQFNRDTYLTYKKYLASRTDMSLATKSKYLTVAKVLLKEMNRKGMLPVDITSTIKGFKQNKKHKKDGLNEDEVATLVSSLRTAPDTNANLRLKSIISLLIFQGLRQIEIARLDVEDLDFTRGTALVLGKGREDKEIIYLHPETSLAVKKYVTAWKIKSGPLFSSSSNNSKHHRISTRSIRGLVKGELDKLGIKKTTHGFRHYFTTKLIKTYKGDLLEVAQYTRHRGLEMLQVYNDTIKQEADLPRYYSAFNGISFENEKQAPTSHNSNYRK